MTLSSILSFTLASFILAIAPGPDVIFVLTNSALYGARMGILVALGLSIGIIVQTLCMMVGLTALITTIPALMLAIQLCGVAYLSYLAYQALKATYALYRKSRLAHDSLDSQSASTLAQHTQQAAHLDLSTFKLIRRGFIMNITNPKVQLFFLSFFPQFLPHGVQGFSLMLAITTLGCILSVISLIVFSTISLGAGTLSAFFTSDRFNLILNGLAALIFSSLAAYTLISALYLLH